MKQSMKVTECPKCGGKEFGKGKHSRDGSVLPYNKALGVGVEHIRRFSLNRCFSATSIT